MSEIASGRKKFLGGSRQERQHRKTVKQRAGQYNGIESEDENLSENSTHRVEKKMMMREENRKRVENAGRGRRKGGGEKCRR